MLEIVLAEHRTHLSAEICDGIIASHYKAAVTRKLAVLIVSTHTEEYYDPLPTVRSAPVRKTETTWAAGCRAPLRADLQAPLRVDAATA